MFPSYSTLAGTRIHVADTLAILVLGILSAVAPVRAQEPDGRWSLSKAVAWREAQPWLIGCNFLPSSAANNIEMWQDFDPVTIDRELGWARQVEPTQPLTVGEFHDHAQLNELIHRHSDITSFHNYGSVEDLTRHLQAMQRFGRPIVCTEWLNRGLGSTVMDCLPVLRHYRVGCLHWGLVNGKTQTHLPWGHRPGQPDPAVWQHDLFRPDRNPYDAEEIERFRHVLQWALSPIPR